MPSPLDGLRVLDLSRVLAGPVCTQILGDLGADIIKIERPGEGDDTRRWGPPYLKDKNGQDTAESAYYLSCNRNKRSVSVDFSKPEGQALIRGLAHKSDILIHNFKVGSLEKFGLGYESLRTACPHLIYIALTGFGQNGPLATEPGYDLVAQAMGGLMSHTGDETGEPMKAGVALVDVMTGLYAAIGALSALHARQTTGKGQLVDLALLDVSLASMTNIAQYYLTSGQAPRRFGNAHATIVPYQNFQAKDGYLVIAVGNDRQFARLCEALGHPEWAQDPRFIHNDARVENREILVDSIGSVLKTRSAQDWVELFLSIDVPAGRVNRIDEAFAQEQIAARDMKISMPHPLSPSNINLVGNPLHLSDTPVSYRHAPPVMGADTKAVFKDILGINEAELADLKSKNII